MHHRSRDSRPGSGRPPSDAIDETTFRETLAAGLTALPLTVAEPAFELFTNHYRELIRWRRRADLTSLTDARDIAIRHVLDSLTLAPLVPTGLRIADLGSGAGFPGVPLAIARADLDVTLLETRQLKLAFLHHLATQLLLPNLQVGAGAPFDAVAARAVANLGETLALALPHLNQGGLVFVMRGPRREGEGETPAGFVRVAEHQRTLPLDDAPRRILVFERASP